ncbi:MAG: hypothetical protein FWC93_01780 [Defluviitaleaceae bacterium]|nr:hypothetical protein [Defluviitaleaceae bacterium]
MTRKFQNRVKQLLYRPAKRHPHVEYVAKVLTEAEDALDNTVGGVFSGKKTRKSKPKEEEKK